MPNAIKYLILFILAVCEYGNSWDHWQRLGILKVPRTAGEHWRKRKEPTNTDGHKGPLNIKELEMAVVGGELGSILSKKQVVSAGTCVNYMKEKPWRGFQNVLKPFNIMLLIQKANP